MNRRFFSDLLIIFTVFWCCLIFIYSPFHGWDRTIFWGGALFRLILLKTSFKIPPLRSRNLSFLAKRNFFKNYRNDIFLTEFPVLISPLYGVLQVVFCLCYKKIKIFFCALFHLLFYGL